MRVIQWLVLVPWVWLISLIAYIPAFARWLVKFATPQEGPCDNNNAVRVEPRLPSWLSWFMTPDNSLYGDYGWRTEHRPNDWQTPEGMAAWLRRNPACGFDYVIAANIKPDAKPKCYGDPFTQDGPVGKAGWVLVIIDGYFSVYGIVRLGKVRCLKVDLGWNLKTYAEDPNRVKTQPKAGFSASIRLPQFKS